MEETEEGRGEKERVKDSARTIIPYPKMHFLSTDILLLSDGELLFQCSVQESPVAIAPRQSLSQMTYLPVTTLPA